MSADDRDDTRPGSRSAPPQRGSLLCAAPGCPWSGSAGEAGRFMCIAHWGHEPSQWSAVTARTIELEWFATFIHDVQRMANFPRKGEQPWHAYAAQFWVNTDPTMGPQPEEMRRGAPVYLYRLLGELRAMALGKDRPGLHQPQADWPSFQPTGTSAAGAAPVVVAVPFPAPLPAPVNEPPRWVLDDVPLADDALFSDPNHVSEAA